MRCDPHARADFRQQRRAGGIPVGVAVVAPYAPTNNKFMP